LLHHHPSSIIIHHPSSSIIHHHPSSIIIHHPSSIIHHPSIVIHRPSSIVHMADTSVHIHERACELITLMGGLSKHADRSKSYWRNFIAKFRLSVRDLILLVDEMADVYHVYCELLAQPQHNLLDSKIVSAQATSYGQRLQEIVNRQTTLLSELSDSLSKDPSATTLDFELSLSPSVTLGTDAASMLGLLYRLASALRGGGEDPATLLDAIEERLTAIADTLATMIGALRRSLEYVSLSVSAASLATPPLQATLAVRATESVRTLINQLATVKT
jgi:hypothetical protein